MATVIQNTIGTGGDYSTVQSWEDAAPADLVAADQVWEGLCLNQNFQTAIAIGGSTTNASCYKHLTAQVGESFADLVGEPLRLIPGNGAEISKPDGYGAVITVSEANARIDRLQIYATQSTTVGVDAATANPFVISDCIIYTLGRRTLKLYGSSAFGYNLLLLVQGGTWDIVDTSGSSWIESSTLIRGGATPSGTGLAGQYGTSTVKNVAIFNCATTSSGSNARTFVNCFTDVAAPPAGFTVVPYDTTTGSGFVNITTGSYDFKLNPSSAMVDAGVDTAYPTDIYGTERPQGSGYDAGCFELVQGGTSVDHHTSGAVIGPGADVTGSATHHATVEVHPTAGNVVGRESVVTGSATNIRHMTSTGAVVGFDTTITGTANRYREHPSSGSLSGNLAAVTGDADNFTPAGIHDTYGDVDAGYGTVTGDSHSVGYRPTSGAVVGNPANVVGTAHHARKHTTTGNPIGNGTTITGTAARKDPVLDHGTFGTVTGYTSNVNGVAVAGVSTLTPIDIENIVNAVWSDPRALTVSKFLALQNP